MPTLPSWRDGAARSAITSFVEEVAAGAVPVAERVAVFDDWSRVFADSGTDAE